MIRFFNSFQYRDTVGVNIIQINIEWYMYYYLSVEILGFGFYIRFNK